MFAVNTYEEIEKLERELNEKHIIILLFVRPGSAGAKEIIDEFDYIHHNAGAYCSVYAVGYSNDSGKAGQAGFKKVTGVDNADWYFSYRAFVAFKDNLERRLKWRYSGETEMIILQSNPDGRHVLNFEHYLVVDINYGIRKEYIASFPRFMESLLRSARSEVEVTAAADKTRKYQIRKQDIVTMALDECKKIPGPVRRIVRDRAFYRTSRSY